MRAARKARVDEWNMTMRELVNNEDFGIGAVLNALRMLVEV